MTAFSAYARYYDLLYRDKDYAGEAACTLALIRARRPEARTILDLGCGSGRHDRPLADLGCQVTGVDVSEQMLGLAIKAAEGNPNLEYVAGDIRTLRLGRAFDAVVSLFHVMSYQSANEDLDQAFETARVHLSPCGIFVFDCWYGPGVLTDPPVVKVKELEDECLHVQRIAYPTMHPSEDLVEVDFRIRVRDKSTGDEVDIQESHRMRYLFLPEIRRLLERAGLCLLDAHESFHPSVAPTLRTWNLTVVAGIPSPASGCLR